MIPAQLEYMRASTLEEALRALAEPDSKVIAGGQSLVSVMKLRLARPSLLVDIADLPLRGVDSSDEELHLGALTTWDELAARPELERPALGAIRECASAIGDLQVRNRGTVGGSLAHADPASDFPAVALALDATLRLRSADGERDVPAAQFFVGPFSTVLEPYELLTEIVVPMPTPGSGSAYESVEHPASGFALAGAAVVARPDGTSAVALTGVGAQPFLLERDLASAAIYGDDFAPEEYRRHLADVVVGRALERAKTRAEEDRRWQA